MNCRIVLAVAVTLAVVPGCETLNAPAYLYGQQVSDSARAAVFKAQVRQVVDVGGEDVALCLSVGIGDGDLMEPGLSTVQQILPMEAPLLSPRECDERGYDPKSSVTLPGETKTRRVALIENGNATKAKTGELSIYGSAALGDQHWSGDYKVVEHNGEWKVVDGPKP